MTPLLHPVPPSRDLRTLLLEQLTSKEGLDLQQAENIDALFLEREPEPRDGNSKPFDRAFVLADTEKPLHVQAFKQFDLYSSGLVRDRVLGTIGILQIIPAENPEGLETHNEALRDWFHQRIDEAVYLRHLLVERTRADGTEPQAQPYTVELVFIAADQSSPGLQIAGEVLRLLMRETTFLHAVGVSIWRYPLESAVHQRRAFSWLLNATRKWLDAPQLSRKRNETKRGGFSGISLEHFRVAGTRTLKLAKNQRLHLVHGHNGSGKSSIVEALELSVTGRIERIEERRAQPGEAVTYQSILTNKHVISASSARLTLHWEPGSNGKEKTRTVTPTGIEEALCEELKAGSFRIDQRFADRLAAGSPVERARTFIETFFDEYKRQISDWQNARASFESSLLPLPDDLRHPLIRNQAESSQTDSDAGLAVQELAWIAGDEIPWAKVRKLLPFRPEIVDVLEPLLEKKLVGQLRQTVNLSWEQTLGQAQEADDALERCRTNADLQRQTLHAAAAVLDALGSRTIGDQVSSDRSLPELMNEWLELQALSDLFEKEHAVLATLQAAERASFEFRGKQILVLAQAKQTPAMSEREATLRDLREARDLARRHLAGFASQEERAARSHNAGTADPIPAALDYAALDRAAGMGVFGDDLRSTNPPLGYAVRAAFHEHRIIEIVAGSRTLRIGEPRWGEELRSRLQSVRNALDTFAPSLTTVHGPRLNPLLTALRQTHLTATKLLQTDRSVVHEFAKLVGDGGPFSLAINEFMALLTPARWAYEDLTPRVELKQASQEFEFAVDRVPAQLRLNTAELNTLALGFFLLCARRVEDNPLKLLILDDPLQNMDEFTVTTVSRGLCKLLRLWDRIDSTLPENETQDTPGSPWQILLLLHGEEDVERVRSETPCMVYYLPWLSPDQCATGASAPGVECERSWMQRSLQSLERAFVRIF